VVAPATEGTRGFGLVTEAICGKDSSGSSLVDGSCWNIETCLTREWLDVQYDRR
jgi:hypothetical protein